MTVIARDAVASDHLVYAWPFPLGPECEVTCADDEQVVMCPSWLVGDRLGPGRHHWRTPDPMRPTAAFFVRTAPVETSFDMTTSFMIPSTGQPVRLRATGSLQVRCVDPGLLIAQFVGLPFDHVNAGVLRSVSRSVERMLARLLTRRVVLAGSPYAVTDPQMLGGIVEELVSYNPAAGAVFGVDLLRVGHVTIAADDGSTPYVVLPVSHDWSSAGHHLPPMAPMPPNHERGSQPIIEPPPSASSSAPLAASRRADDPLLQTARGRPPSHYDTPRPRPSSAPPPDHGAHVGPGGPGGQNGQPATASGEIVVRTKAPSQPGFALGSNPPSDLIEMPRSPDEITQPGVKTPTPGAVGLQTPVPPRDAPAPPRPEEASRGAILGIGVGHIGSTGAIGSSNTGGAVSGEIGPKVPPGARVLVPGPNGLMQSATVRQLLSGYYELEVGSSGETIWVPINGVVPE
ncbi:MAG: hypothetical protein ACTHU0_33860 [Kofleriaceae bacterium]